MNAVTTLFVLVAAGVNYGWQPAGSNSDAYEYVVQVEPELLDALRRGDAVPIESNVPADVGPIRKVRITVGRGDVPRQSLAAVNHTAYFAGQGTWTPGQTDPSITSQYDRYATQPGGSVSPPPDYLQRAQAAVTESGTTISQGIEAGIEAANQQLSRTGNQLLDATRGVSQDISRQAEQWANNPGQQMQAVGNELRSGLERSVQTLGNSFQLPSNPNASTAAQPGGANTRMQSVVSPPPWPQANGNGQQTLAGTSGNTSPLSGSAAATAAPTRTATGWTSIGSNIAAPPLVAPQLGTVPTGANAQTMMRTATASGPGFPAAASAAGGAGSLSPVANPVNSQGTNPADNWPMAQSASPATISRSGNAATFGGNDGGSPGLANSQSSGNYPQSQQQGASQFADPFAGTNTWPEQSSANSVGSVGQGDLANTVNATQPAWVYGAGQSVHNTGSQVGQPPTGPYGPGQYTVGTPNQPGTLGGTMPGTLLGDAATDFGRATTLAAQGNQPPWVPFVVVCLTLVGSLSANLFLGWSYLDARQRYRLLVRKTADTFRRVTGSAA